MLIVASVVLGTGVWLWLVTRKLIVLEMPVSLAAGRVRTPEFSVNLESNYGISIEVQRTAALPRLECQMFGCETPSILKVRWVLSEGGTPVLSGANERTDGVGGDVDSIGRYIGGFRSLSSGRFILNMDVLSDAGVLNLGTPRLIVRADGDGYERNAYWTRFLLSMPPIPLIIGIAILWTSRKDALHVDTNSIVYPSSVGPPRWVFRPRRPPAVKLFSKLPSFGLCAVQVWLLVPLCFSAFEQSFAPSRGLRALMSSRSIPKSVYVQPVVLRIDRHDRWFLDGKPVRSEQLPAALKKALGRSADWTVCLDADSLLDFDSVATAIDVMQGMGVKPILVTPKLRSDVCVMR